MLHHIGLAWEEKTASLLQLDYLIPLQFFGTYRRKIYLEPERVLMLAVLEDAISCLEKYATCASGKHKKLFEETRTWILTDDDDWLFSFNNVCEAVGLHPGRLRRALIQMAESRCRVKSTTLNSAHRVHPQRELRPRG